MGFSQEMRRKRLEFYEEDINAIEQIMSDFLDASGSKAVFMVDKEGHLVTKKGFTKSLDGDSLAALVAGAFASTREVAKLLGEQEFSVLFHQGQNEHIHVSLVMDRALIVTVFDERTTMGMVRLYAEEVTTKISDVLRKMMERADKEDPRGLGQDGEDFADSAEEKLSDFFKEDN
ncbi:MAG TPA: roadblock/LC7 domain-containing protein [Planctomycetes bacterium]|mgnify:CR=1 FL=1|nr:roadblock/LC7 domain-containing protein [Planctomycetota bacterium]